MIAARRSAGVLSATGGRLTYFGNCIILSIKISEQELIYLSLKQYLEIGKITSVHGLRGEVKVQPWCDDPEFLASFESLYYKSGTEVVIEYARVQKNMVVMKIEDCDTVEEAQKLRNRILFMDRDDVELDAGCYFVQDLIGMEVRHAETGKVYGLITDVSETGANDVYTIKSEDGKEYLIPAIPDVIVKNDIENRIMTIIPLEGLFDEEDNG